MHCYPKYILSLFLFVAVSFNSLYSQVFLQLERYNNPKSLKFYEGDILEFRTHKFPKTWRTHEIIDLKPDEQLIVFGDQYYTIDEIKDIRLRYPAIKSIGYKFLQFSAAWFVYGGIATLVDDDFTIGRDDVIIGASFALTGLILSNLFHKKKIRLNKKRRLRIMDLRFKLDSNY